MINKHTIYKYKKGLITIRKEKSFILIFIYIIIVLISSYVFVRKSNEILFYNKAENVFSTPVNKKVILLDAGHGGFDPGKVGTNKIYEKDVNLAIVDKVHMLLEQSGAIVYTTRVDDKALGETKMEDMRKRVYISNTLKPDIMISIHQNSNPDERAKGAEIYYFKSSEKSHMLATSVQKGLNDFIGYKKKRSEKANTSYYMLKKISVPSIIIECGFLSSPQETKLLLNEEYQNKIAWGIYMGILNYYEEVAK